MLQPIWPGTEVRYWECSKAIVNDRIVLVSGCWRWPVILWRKINSLAQIFYAFSCTVCTPNSLSQEVGLGLGAQAARSADRVLQKARAHLDPAGCENANQHGLGNDA